LNKVIVAHTVTHTLNDIAAAGHDVVDDDETGHFAFSLGYSLY